MSKLRSAEATLERGFSLFEVLITVVVISIGLLGLAGLQFAGLRAANNAQEHTLATLLAQDIAERLHANRSVAASYDGITLDNASGVALAKDCADITKNCLPDELKNYDSYEWYQLIAPTTGAPLLPNLSISINLTNVDAFAVASFQSTLKWGDHSTGQSLITDFSVCTNTNPNPTPPLCTDP